MKRFGELRIRWKLLLVLMLTSTVSLLILGGTLLAYELATFRRGLVNDLTSLARIMSANTVAALAFANPEDAVETLAGLAATPQILHACIYAESGALFARYGRRGTATACPPLPKERTPRFTDDEIVLSEPILRDGDRLGTLLLEASLGDMKKRTRLYAGIVAVVLVGSASVALLLSLFLQRTISGPITNLAQVARTISEKKDYSVRAAKQVPDEIGLLAEAFNDMLAELQKQRRQELEAELVQRRAAEEEVRRLNEELQERVALLEGANKELDAFSYSVSHDLRAPLRAIDGFSRILLDEHGAQISADAALYLHKVRDNTLHMAQLIDDLLEFSRLGRQPLDRIGVDPAGVVARALASLASEKEGRQVSIAVGDLPRCQADPRLLLQVYVNLLSNALKFTRKCKEARIQIGCRAEQGENVYFVKDNGAGFDMRYAGKLFGVFQRLHRKNEYEGTGVGLAVVQRIVLRHGGRVWGEGEVGKGATFFFTLATRGDTHAA